MDEKKLKFLSWLGWILITIGGMASITAYDFANYEFQRKIVRISLILIFMIPGIVLEMFVYFQRRRKSK